MAVSIAMGWKFWESWTLKRTRAKEREDYDNLQVIHTNLLQRLDRSSLVNPTWSELKNFLEQDNTETLVYIEDEFDCEGFTLTLRDRAGKQGFRSAYVAINFGDAVAGHTLNAFETTEKGIVYVDDTGDTEGTGIDGIGYMEVGQPYGTVPLDAVKSDYIACEGSPDEFWHPLTYKSHDNPFSYDYYLLYRNRLEFYNQSVVAYNEAVSQYNRGSTKWSSLQLDKWNENLDALKRDLALPSFKPMSIVESIEVYWN